MTSTTSQEWIKAAIENDRDALIDGIKFLFNCHEADVDADGRVWIEQPQRGHWVDDEKLAKIARALQAGDI